MATESPANGSGVATDGLSAAEKLMKQHAAEEAESHKATVEDVPDEDLGVASLQPPGPGVVSLPISTDPSRVATPSAEPTMSAKAAGKQPARDQPQTNVTSKPAFDTNSEDAFPALGAPKAPSAAAAPTPWSRKPASVGKAANGVSNGVPNGSNPSSRRTSGASTPLSGIVTPSTTAPSQRGPAPQVSLPGRYSEQIQLHPSMMTPRNQLKKPVTDILRDINKRSKANVEMKAGPGGVVVFEGTGPVDAVRVALKEVATQLCSKVCDTYNHTSTQNLIISSKIYKYLFLHPFVARSLESKAQLFKRSRRRLAHESTSPSKRRPTSWKMMIWIARSMSRLKEIHSPCRWRSRTSRESSASTLLLSIHVSSISHRSTTHSWLGRITLV